MLDREQKFANIVIPPLNKPYTYSIPRDLESEIQLGSVVEVSLGKRLVCGYVINLTSASELNQELDSSLIKDVNKLIVKKSFNKEQLELFEWVANYYSTPLANVIETAIPPWQNPTINKFVEIINPDFSKVKGGKQKLILEFLQKEIKPCPLELINRNFKSCHTTLKSLETLNLIKINLLENTNTHLDYVSSHGWAKKSVDLNTEQEQAVSEIYENIKENQFKPFLLHGVTGSGKTEVYIEAAKLALENNCGVLVLVPEIALTPQLISRFSARLGQYGVAILHSAMNKKARWSAWQALIKKEAKLAIGARSAIFAPIDNLKLIIVDEEHDHSYKQAEGLRYNARDTAVKRALQANCPVILGSATPSMESFYNAMRKKYKYVSLSARHSSGSNISIQIVDLNQIPPWEMPAQHISPALHKALKEALANGEQAFILYNRRGFASYYQCNLCASTIECPNCSVTLTYHQHHHKLLCHYCNLSIIPSEFCPICSSSEDQSKKANPGKLEQRGAGTEKVFDELRELFPEYQIARLDRDVTEDPTSYEKIFEDLRNGSLKILVGTQMIAKGHDLPNVTLVGIADSDVGLNLPDFRSAEKAFQLLTQASGRAGRSNKPGHVILQTRNPKHISIVKTYEKNFAEFAQLELRKRKDSFYPPYTKLIRLVASSEHFNEPEEVLRNLKNNLVSAIESNEIKAVSILGPTTAPLAKLKTLYRWHMLIKAQTLADQQTVIKIINEIRRKTKVRLAFDRDPYDML
jgi:primosomal protein N' (replication factor Y)